MPPYACSFVFSIVAAYFSDKYKNRGVMAIVCALIAAAGFALFLGAFPVPTVRRIMLEARFLIIYQHRLRQQRHQLWCALLTDYWQLRHGTVPLHVECE